MMASMCEANNSFLRRGRTTLKPPAVGLKPCLLLVMRSSEFKNVALSSSIHLTMMREMAGLLTLSPGMSSSASL